MAISRRHPSTRELSPSLRQYSLSLANLFTAYFVCSCSGVGNNTATSWSRGEVGWWEEQVDLLPLPPLNIHMVSSNTHIMQNCCIAKLICTVTLLELKVPIRCNWCNSYLTFVCAHSWKCRKAGHLAEDCTVKDTEWQRKHGTSRLSAQLQEYYAK